MALVISIIVPLGITAIRKTAYPLRHTDAILGASTEFGVDSFLIAAMIKVESNYQPRAVSKKGAVGLMQLLPDTAQQAASKIGLRGYTPESLYDPAINIRLGAWYLSYLMGEFGGDRTLSLAAYNGGIRNVRDWRQRGLVQPGGSVEGIPFKETRDFVGRVEAAVRNYKDLYTFELSRETSSTTPD